MSSTPTPSRRPGPRPPPRRAPPPKPALWDESGGYYRLDTNGPFSSALLADALCGQRYSARDGLPDVLDRAADGVAPEPGLSAQRAGGRRRADGGHQRRGPDGPTHRHRPGQGGVAGGHVLHGRAHAHRGPRPPATATSSPTRSPPGTASTGPPTTTTGPPSGSTPPPCGSPTGTRRTPCSTGPPPTNGAGRHGSCWWRSKTRSRWDGSPRCEPAIAAGPGPTRLIITGAGARAMIGWCRDQRSSRARPEARLTGRLLGGLDQPGRSQLRPCRRARARPR